MRENSFYARISRFYASQARCNMAWEAKFTRRRSIPFSCLESHQEAALLKAQGCFTGKIADVGVAKKPFDGFVLYQAYAVVIIIFERHQSHRKSLTIERAAQIGILIKIWELYT